MKQPRSFVVRIYLGERGKATGIVEDSRTGRRRSFSDKDELWLLLQRRAWRRGLATGAPEGSPDDSVD